MNEWHDLFVATAGSAAALTGLIFVGVSINLQKILSFPTLPERALLSLIFLLTILILSVIFLIPQQTILNTGIEVLVLAIIAWLITLFINFRIQKHIDTRFKKANSINFLLNQLAVLPYVICGIFLLVHEKGVYWIVVGFILSFIKVVIDAWVLLIEINR